MLESIRLHWRCAALVIQVGLSAFVVGHWTAMRPQPEIRATHEEEAKADVRRETKLETNTGTVTIDREIEEDLPAACPPAPRPLAARAPGCPCDVLASQAAPAPGKRTTRERITVGPSTTKLDDKVAGILTGNVKDDLHVIPPPALPRYRVGALVGAQLVPLSFPPPIMVGGHVEMRLGELPIVRAPVWVGVWAMTTPTNPAAHVSLGVSAVLEW